MKRAEKVEKYSSADLYRVVLYILCFEQAVKIENYFCNETRGESRRDQEGSGDTGEMQALP